MSPSTEASAWVQSAKQGHEAAHVVNVVYFVFRDKIFFISLFIFFFRVLLDVPLSYFVILSLLRQSCLAASQLRGGNGCRKDAARGSQSWSA